MALIESMSLKNVESDLIFSRLIKDYDESIRQELNLVEIEQRQEFRKRTLQEKKWLELDLPSNSSEIESIMSSRLQQDIQHQKKKNEVIEKINQEFKSRIIVHCRRPSVLQDIGETSSHTSGEVPALKINPNTLERDSLLVESPDREQSKWVEYFVGESEGDSILSLESADSIVDSHFNSDRPVDLQLTARHLSATLASLNDIMQSFNTLSETRDSVIEGHSSEIEPIKYAPDTIPEIRVDSKAEKRIATHWFIKVFEFETNEYKTIRVKPDMTVWDLLKYCLDKFLDIVDESKILEYCMMESLSAGESRIMDTSEVLADALEMNRAGSEQVFFFKKKSTVDHFKSVSKKQTTSMKLTAALLKEVLSMEVYKHKSGPLKSWNKRWMSISKSNKKLLFFKDSSEQDEKFSMDIVKITGISKVDPEDQSSFGALPVQGLMFRIFTVEGETVLVGSNIERCLKAIETLNSLAAKLKIYSSRRAVRASTFKTKKGMVKRVNDLNEKENSILHDLVADRTILLMDQYNIMPASKLASHLKNSKQSAVSKFFQKKNRKKDMAVFGVSLEVAAERSESTVHHKNFIRCPKIVDETVDYLEEHALNTHGIFRIPGSNRRIDTLKKLYDSGEPVDFEGYTVHDIAGLLKLYLRELPEPLFTIKLLKPFMETEKVRDERLKFKIQQLLFMLLPVSHRHVLEKLLRFLQKVAENATKSVETKEGESSLDDKGNRMDASNLAKIFGPNLFRDKGDDSSKVSYQSLNAYAFAANILQTFIERQVELFIVNFG